MKWINELRTPYNNRLTDEKIKDLAHLLPDFKITSTQKFLCNKHLVGWTGALLCAIPFTFVWLFSSESFKDSTWGGVTFVMIFLIAPFLFWFGYSSAKTKFDSLVNKYLDSIDSFLVFNEIQKELENFSIDSKKKQAVNSLTNQPLRNKSIHKWLKFDSINSYVVYGKYNEQKFEVECARFYPKHSMYNKPINEDNRLWEIVGPEWLNTLLVLKEDNSIIGELGIQACVPKGKKQTLPTMFEHPKCTVSNHIFNVYFDVYGNQELANKVLTIEKQNALIEMFKRFNNVFISYSKDGVGVSFEVANNFLWPRAVMIDKFVIDKSMIVKSLEYSYLEFLQVFSYVSVISE